MALHIKVGIKVKKNNLYTKYTNVSNDFGGFYSNTAKIESFFDGRDKKSLERIIQIL